jgi:anti-sigma factor RsiW
MTDCPNGDIRDLLPDLLNGRLAPDQRAEVEAHLRTCADCREEMELLRSMRRSMHRAPAVAVADIVGALPAYRAPVRHPGRGWGIAAAVALLIGGGTSIVVSRNEHVLQRESTRVAIIPAITPSPTQPAPAHVAQTKAHAVPKSHAASPAPAAEAPRELAVASANVGDLSEAELDALVNDLGSLDAVTPVDVDQPATVSPIPPTSTSGTGA